MDEIELTPEERKKMSYLSGEIKKCAKCKKTFFVARSNQANYVYRRSNRFYCSWACYRKGKKK